MSRPGLASLAERAGFDTLIDARSPAEFAEDHLPGAVNFPTLDNAERARVGTLYAQVSAFEARKVGGALAARNIAHWLEQAWQARGRDWKPLVYCWRGGMRSGSAVTVMRMVGWDAAQLQGGYKGWRRHVIELLAERMPRLPLRVISGATGSGKTRLLGALAAQGAQVIDLEGLAAHRGSVLGGLPDQAQPTQKHFETRLAAVVETLDPARPVYVEAESRKIGRIALPDSVLMPLRAAPVIEIVASAQARSTLLLEDYAWLGADPAALVARLGQLQGLVANECLARWQQQARSGDLQALTLSLLAEHYDPLYARSQRQNLDGLGRARRHACEDLGPAGLAALARQIHADDGA